MSLPCSRSRKAASAPGRSVHVISGYLINVASHRGAERWRHKSADRSIVRRASAPPFCRIENDFFKQKGGLWSAHCAVPATKACSISLKDDRVCAQQIEEVRALREGPTSSLPRLD